MSYRTVLEMINLLFPSDLEKASPCNSYDNFIASVLTRKMSDETRRTRMHSSRVSSLKRLNILRYALTLILIAVVSR
jgi:hypothetical protein